MANAIARRCVNHPERSPFAVCMTCTSSVCQECATQWDGIWYCARCLAAKRGATVERSRVGGWLLALLGSAILFYVAAHLMIWTGALLAGLF
jgi:hypothetical protein